MRIGWLLLLLLGVSAGSLVGDVDADVVVGTVMLGQGFVTNYHALAGCRALLGAFEAGFFPGTVYLITCWYVTLLTDSCTRSDWLQVRAL